MSRIGKKPVELPQGVTATLDNNKIIIKGPKGEDFHTFDTNKVDVRIEQNHILVEPKIKDLKEARAYWGLTRNLINNMVKGVLQGFEKKLVVEGVGYRANLQGNKLVLTIGYSKPIELQIPNDLSVQVKDNTITISGKSKYLVGQFTAVVRSKRLPDAYKGKGIRYAGEQLKLKVGKSGV
ncbi:MAG: 50S ribosomal protein L6 [Spirochaetes bacterium]|nr:50S ribosomal protein L6 [Spirochaetota bacterium]